MEYYFSENVQKKNWVIICQKHHPSEETENGMVRGLQNRHVQLIAIAGTIGTGLFLGAGRSLSLTGPSIIFSLYADWRLHVLDDAGNRRNALYGP